MVGRRGEKGRVLGGIQGGRRVEGGATRQKLRGTPLPRHGGEGILGRGRLDASKNFQGRKIDGDRQLDRAKPSHDATNNIQEAY